MRNRLLSVVMALLLVSSAFVAPASAQTDSSECDGLMSFIQNTVVLGLTGTQLEQCSPDNDQLQQMKESDGEQEEIDLYESAVAEKSNSEAFLATYGNNLQDTESVAWMKMQVAVAEAYQDGSSKSIAKSKARQAISDYYAVKQLNLIDKWETTLATHEYLRETAQNETNVSSNFVELDYNIDGSSTLSATDAYTNSGAMTTESLPLVNGSSESVDSLQIDFKYYDNSDEYFVYQDKLNPDATHSTGHGSGNTIYINGLRVSAPNSNYESKLYQDQQRYKDNWESIKTKNNELQSEAENFVEATYADFDSGEANASDVISANTAMFEYGTEATSNESGLYDSTAALSMMGYDTPNMSNSGTQDVSYKGNQYTGIVLARNAPGGGWETGTTYNTSNISGPVFLATTDGQKVDFEEGQTFTIDQMRTKDGGNTTTVNTTNYVYKTANTSELNDMQNELITLRQEIEAREPSGGGGSGSGLGNKTIIAGAALAGAALLFGRSQD